MYKDTTIPNNMPQGDITIDELEEDISGRNGGKPLKAVKPLHRKKNSFPIEVLPLKAQEYVKGAHKTLGTPKDFFAASMLFTAASAAGNTCKLEVKTGVEQKAVFYMVLIGLPNSNKSGALKIAIKPLLNEDTSNYKKYKSQKAEYDAIKGLSKKERQAQGITELTPPPIFHRAVIQDATPEAVASALQDSPRGITLYRDELTGFIKDFNRYNQGGEQEFWLSNWSGITLSIDRKTSEPIRIKNPFIPMIGTMQPGVLEELAKGARVANGFIDRYLPVWPDGLKKPEWALGEINFDLVQAYETAIDR